MQVSLDKIKSWELCDEYTDERIEKLFRSVCGRRKHMKLENALKLNISPLDILWLILMAGFIPKQKMHEIAIFCWDKIAREIWEKYYPDDKRPQEAFEIKKLWLQGKATDHQLADAEHAVWIASQHAYWVFNMDAAFASSVVAIWSNVEDNVEDSVWTTAVKVNRGVAAEKILNFIGEINE